MDELKYCYIQKSIQESIARARDLEITEFAAQELDLEVQFLSISVTDPDALHLDRSESPDPVPLRFLFPDPIYFKY